MLEFLPNNKNLTILGVAYFCIQVQFWFPIWVIFLLDRGLTLNQIVIADIVYWGAIVVLEFPTGVIGDKIGRRTTFSIAAFFGALAYLFMLMIHSFWFLILSWLMWAIYIATISGTDNAYIYELIVDANMQSRAKYIFGYFSAIRYSAIFLSVLFAGYLYVVNSNIPILLNAILAIVSGIVVLFLPKTKFKIIHKPREILSEVMKYEKNNRSVRYFTIFIAIFYVYTWTATLLFQPLLEDLEVPIQQFGFIFATFPLFAILGGLFAGKLSDWWGDKFHLFFTTIFLIVSMLFIGILPGKSTIAGIIFLELNYALIQPIFLERINNEIHNEIRASILSFASLIGSLCLMLTRPLIVIISNLSSIKEAYTIWSGSGIILIILMSKYFFTR